MEQILLKHLYAESRLHRKHLAAVGACWKMKVTPSWESQNHRVIEAGKEL